MPFCILEWVAGFEPANTALRAAALPLGYTHSVFSKELKNPPFKRGFRENIGKVKNHLLNRGVFSATTIHILQIRHIIYISTEYAYKQMDKKS